MTIGKLLKEYRVSKNLSQPELSEKANIEQSYLSKIENDKSLPSDEIFEAILLAMDIPLAEFVSKEEYLASPNSYNQLPILKQHFEQQKKQTQVSQRNFLYLCTLFIALGVASFYSGWRATLFSDQIYIYESNGLVLKNEPIDIFNRNIADLVDRSEPGHEQKLRKLRFSLAPRNTNEYQNHSSYMGEDYVQNLPDGRRLFRLDKTKYVPNVANGMLQFFGVLLICLGAIGFIVERKVYP